MHPSAENEMRRKRWFRRENKAAGAHSQHWGQQQLCPQVAERGAAHPGCEAWWFTVLQLQRFPWISSWFLVPFVRWQVSFHFYLSSQLVLHWKFDGEQRLHTEVPFQEDSQCRSLLSVKYWELQHSLALGKWNEWAQIPTPAGNSETGCLGELEATSLDVHGNFPLSATHSYLLSAEREDEHTASTPPWRCGQDRITRTCFVTVCVLLTLSSNLPPGAMQNHNLPQPALQHQCAEQIIHFSMGRKREGSFRESGCSQLAVISSSLSD